MMTLVEIFKYGSVCKKKKWLVKIREIKTSNMVNLDMNS